MDFLAQSLETLADQGLDIIPVIWSYGAWVGGSAIENVTKVSRSKEGKTGGVIGLVYAAAVPPTHPGENASEIMADWGGANNAWYDPQLLQGSNITYGPLIELGNPAPIFYIGNPYHHPSIFNPTVRPWSAGASVSPIPFVPITPNSSVVPTAYIHTLKDLSVPTRVQEQVLERYSSSLKDVIKVESGHLWMIDQPARSVEGLIKFAKALCE